MIGNKFNIVKKRFVLWTSFVLVASIATAASFNIPVPRTYTKADQARDLGVSVEEMEKVRKMGFQLSSDLYCHRPTNENDVQYLMDLADGGSKLGIRTMWQLIVLKGTKHEARLIEIAHKWSSSPDEDVAFVAIANLRYFKDPRWNQLARSYPWKTKEYREDLLQPQTH